MDFWRQHDVVNQDLINRHPYTLVGAGGIGSVVALALVKMGVRRLEVWDPDIVEEHNLPNQLYRLSDVGRPKVEALADICREFAGVSITPRQARFPVPSMPRGIVISGVDSMSARSEIWQQIVYNPLVPLYVEGRMGAEEGRVYAVVPHNPDEVARYGRTLYSDEEASEAPCTARATGYNAFFLAGLLTNQVKRYIMSELVSMETFFMLPNNLMIAVQ
jgi:molybdopterin/thiamine biosynthesis adenylyltransferase